MSWLFRFFFVFVFSSSMVPVCTDISVVCRLHSESQLRIHYLPISVRNIPLTFHADVLLFTQPITFYPQSTRLHTCLPKRSCSYFCLYFWFVSYFCEGDFLAVKWLPHSQELFGCLMPCFDLLSDQLTKCCLVKVQQLHLPTRLQFHPVEPTKCFNILSVTS